MKQLGGILYQVEEGTGWHAGIVEGDEDGLTASVRWLTSCPVAEAVARRKLRRLAVVSMASSLREVEQRVRMMEVHHVGANG